MRQLEAQNAELQNGRLSLPRLPSGASTPGGRTSSRLSNRSAQSDMVPGQHAARRRAAQRPSIAPRANAGVGRGKRPPPPAPHVDRVDRLRRLYGLSGAANAPALTGPGPPDDEGRRPVSGSMSSPEAHAGLLLGAPRTPLSGAVGAPRPVPSPNAIASAQLLVPYRLPQSSLDTVQQQHHHHQQPLHQQPHHHHQPLHQQHHQHYAPQQHHHSAATLRPRTPELQGYTPSSIVSNTIQEARQSLDGPPLPPRSRLPTPLLHPLPPRTDLLNVDGRPATRLGTPGDGEVDDLLQWTENLG